MSTTERFQNESRRSECYRLLSALFYPPERSRLLNECTCRNLADLLNELYPEADVSPYAVIMHKQLTELDDTRLQVDHAALFVGPFELKAAPYGSVYLEKNRRVMGDTTMAATDIYAKAGLELTLREPADHIVLELEFMHYLTAIAAEALAAGHEETAAELTRKQRHFLKEHPGAWIPDFCSAIRQETEVLYFRALADCLQGFVSADMRHLKLETTQAC